MRATVVIAGLLVSLMALPTIAQAATWTSAYPVGTMRLQPSMVGVDVFGSAKLNANTAKMTVGGVSQKTYVTNVGPASGHWSYAETQNPSTGVWTAKWTWLPDTAGTTKATIYCYPSALTEGTKAVNVTVKDVNGTTLSYGWSFTLAVPPTFGAPVPAAGSRVTIPTPAIWVPVSDNTGVTSASATVNGQPATATLGGGRVTVTGFTLVADGPITVAVTAGDAAGNTSTKTWTFTLSYYANLTCHTAGCHGTAYDADVAMGPDCVSCHVNVSHAAVHTGGLTGLVGCTGAGCHVDNLVTEHVANHALTCAVCHDSKNADVVAAIASGDAQCDDCHKPLPDHTAVHNATITQGTITFFDYTAEHARLEHSGAIDVNVACGWCHDQMNLVTLHGSNCALCHSGTAPPADSFTTWGGGCSQGSCHPTYHAPASQGHDDAYTDGGNYNNCEGCHAYVNYDHMSPIDGTEAWCRSCH
jgi:hypothetical protein